MSAPLPEDDELLAAELALGLLETVEAAQARARLAADPAFAEAHGRWLTHAAGLAAGLSAAPPEHVWARIVARLPANDDSLRRQLQRWRAGALAAGLAVAALGVALWQRPAPSPVAAPAAAPMVAVLSGKQGTVAVSYDPASGRLASVVSGLRSGGRVPELWVIPADGQPRSLGVLAQGHPDWHRATTRAASAMGAGVTLAVSLEPEGGSPTGLPTGPVILTGKLDRAG